MRQDADDTVTQDYKDKREREQRMVSEMIRLYCRKNHGSKDALCADCAALNAYALERSARCPCMAVSYTHLDVYKRQEVRLCQIKLKY